MRDLAQEIMSDLGTVQELAEKITQEIYGTGTDLDVVNSLTEGEAARTLARWESTLNAFSSEREARLGNTIQYLQERLGEKNRELDALHYVWCSGGCKGGVHRYSAEELTADIVARAIRNTIRLRQWYVNRAGKDYYGDRGFREGEHSWEKLEAAWERARREIGVGSEDRWCQCDPEVRCLAVDDIGKPYHCLNCTKDLPSDHSIRVVLSALMGEVVSAVVTVREAELRGNRTRREAIRDRAWVNEAVDALRVELERYRQEE